MALGSHPEGVLAMLGEEGDPPFKPGPFEPSGFKWERPGENFR